MQSFRKTAAHNDTIPHDCMNYRFQTHPSIHRIALLFLCWTSFGIGFLSGQTPDCLAGSYLNSAHGSAVQRPGMTSYSIGNCAHCHEQHASVGGSEPIPNSPAGPDAYLGAGNEEDLCFACHGTTPVGTAPDIETDITTTNNFGHLAQNYTDIHRVNESLGNTTKHIECTDCHNPHKAGATAHTRPSTEATLLTTTSPLYGVTGASVNYAATASSIWSAPAYTDYNQEQVATKEYQICFKCHSSAVDSNGPESWRGGSGSDPANTSWNWLDIGLEFNPYNKAGHPVVMALNNYPNSIQLVRWPVYYKGLWNVASADETSDPLDTWDQLRDPWGDNFGNQTMYCSDCHTSTSNGPHGSSYKWMLGGTNKAWPFTTAAANGDSTGTFRKIDTLFSWSPLYHQGLGTDDGCFCWNCHPADRNGNGAHQTGNHTSIKCVDCHVRVPHGSKVSRFIAAANYDTYAESEMPLRYTADGKGNNADGTAEPVVKKFTKAVNWSYGKASCYITKSCGGANFDYHNTETNGTESW